MRLRPHCTDLQRAHGMAHRLRFIGRIQGYMLWNYAFAYHCGEQKGQSVFVHATSYRLINDDASLYGQDRMISFVIIAISDQSD